MNGSLPEQGRCSPTGRKWLLGLSILAAACVVAWLLVAHLDLPFPASCVLIAATGLVLYRFSLASTPGVVLWCAAAVAISEAYWMPIRTNGLWVTCILLGGVLPLVSSAVFLIAALENRTRQAVNCAGCVLALFTLITWIVAGRTIHDAIHIQKDIQETTRRLATVHKVAQDVESIRARLGRLPKDEKEFVQLLGKPMPVFGEYDRISYYRNSDLDYRLNFSLRSFWGYGGDFYVASYQGPNTTPRLFVDLF